MSGSVEVAASRRRTSSSRSLSGSKAAGRGPSGPRRRQQAADDADRRARFAATLRSAVIGGSLVEEDADVALRLGQPIARRASERRRQVAAACRASARTMRISMRLPARRPSSAAASRRASELDARRALSARSLLGEQEPGEGDVLELADVGEVVAADRPRSRAQRRPPRSRPCATRPGRMRRRAHVRREVTGVQALGLVEQREGAVQIALGLPDASPGHARAVRILRKPVRRHPARWLWPGLRAAARSSRSRGRRPSPTCMSASPAATGTVLLASRRPRS